MGIALHCSATYQRRSGQQCAEFDLVVVGQRLLIGCERQELANGVVHLLDHLQQEDEGGVHADARGVDALLHVGWSRGMNDTRQNGG